MNWLLDSNILIDYLKGIDSAAEVLQRREASHISRITWIEVMIGAGSADESQVLRAWLAGFAVVEIDESIAERAVELRKQHRLRLPDALILASAQTHGLLLVSRNTKDFPAEQPGVHVPYQL